ncbi:hypothetical protein MNEG_10800 [Monoraphidium neglectum]|uniref:Uncharacterized protein n=1 Tax=Monoraphidium neglectum TaxID=145388 RepID=A0A0D2JBT7_9CHLO|nr:hypothetical protein MNEG_10800 [Monoraphidium neglectum]KIY97162.1 hypothetical protein MNEG_10800 [Monoraphidium neglectum]|eukprot:XP_013896182.1 hypothetical protein MNEG_10800 [Monoraphidium neglectum]
MVSRGAAPRDVPCLPQVWADGSTDQSVVVEVMEHSSEVADSQAAEFFFRDMAVANEATSSQLEGVTALSEGLMEGLMLGSAHCWVIGA